MAANVRSVLVTEPSRLAAAVLAAVLTLAAQRTAHADELVIATGPAVALTGQSPGGARVSGEYDRRLGRRLLLDLHAALLLGADERACYFDRQGALLCDHGAMEGMGLMLGGGVLLPLRTRPAYQAYLRLGAEVGRVSFDADDTSGLALAIRSGAGLRWQLGAKLSLHVEGNLALGATSLEGRRNREVEGGSLAWLELIVGLGFAL